MMTVPVLWKPTGLKLGKPNVRTIPRPAPYTEESQAIWEADMGFRLNRHTNQAPFWDNVWKWKTKKAA